MADSESDIHDIPHFTYIWTIENMCACRCLSSPSFTGEGMDKTRWCLQLYCTENSRLIQLEIRRSIFGPDSIEIKFELSILGIDGLPLIEKLRKQQFYKGHCFKFAIREEVFLKKGSEFLPRDALTIRCRMWRTGTEISKHELSFARTVLREYRGSCVSELREFSSLQVGQKREVLLNPTTEQDIQFTLIFSIREEGDEQYLCIETRSHKAICNGKIKICLLDAKGKVVNSRELPESYRYHLIFGDFFGKRKLMGDKTSLLPDDVLSLRCEFEIVYVVLSGIGNYDCECLKSSVIKEN
ncbi:hypothetical protein AVEN_79280-1 [Araneus ventricosus]|uniref:MATH domain-containing protein n=1 Tax=Araneus ventricosus TaxID=182803 RepID=A0A4Y2JP28_ARAVE|nr:hypothetical protein AVEN_79280-1 [Araneus ventricosus]